MDRAESTMTTIDEGSREEGAEVFGVFPTRSLQ
jgi:hypothetical protein